MQGILPRDSGQAAATCQGRRWFSIGYGALHVLRYEPGEGWTGFSGFAAAYL